MFRFGDGLDDGERRLHTTPRSDSQENGVTVDFCGGRCDINER
jgi:hypothetical protein